MHLLRSSVKRLSAYEAHLSDYLSEQRALRSRRVVGASERRCWQGNIPVLRTDLMDAGLDDVEVLLEFQLPLTSKRADVILAGQHPHTGRPSHVVVELKQWGAAERFEDSDTLVRLEQYGERLGVHLNERSIRNRAVTHPLEQVSGYVDYLTTSPQSWPSSPTNWWGAAYLHNATDLGVADLLDMRSPDQDRPARLFTGQRRSEFLKTRFEPDVSGAPVADAERRYGRVQYRDLMAVFTADPEITVLHGRKEIGMVDPMLLMRARLMGRVCSRWPVAPRRSSTSTGSAARPSSSPLPRRH